MNKGLRIFSMCANIFVGIVLAISVFETSSYYSSYGQGIVLSILRYILAHFVLISEVPLVKPYYLEHFKFYMYPFGRSLIYAILSILSFDLIWCGIVNIIVIGIIAIITFIISFCYKEAESPYMPIKGDDPDDSNSSHSILPCYQPLSTANNLSSNANEIDIKVIPN
ncbi:hypothetical protein K502DRAFT_325469 [Neoconidiobolus thromboides FSU 785]|nr:hypothetical protein K502DRAFT_325469 [Neoconidiobolus thromboides FSU 785]